MIRLYAKSDKVQTPPHVVDAAEARSLNAAGMGIFHTVNHYKGKRRVCNVTKIRYWFIDMDEGTKQEQLSLVTSAPLVPSILVESANGYHCYWKALNGTLENFHIIERGLVEWFGADPKATDPLRLLRAPGYYHHKGEPFLVRERWRRDWAAYTEEQMMEAFPRKEPQRKPQSTSAHDSDWHVDARVGLEALNGTKWVNGERFRLEPTTRGRHNIIRLPDEYSTGCFVDEDGLIGGNRMGNTLASWVRWYGFDSDECKAAVAYARYRGVEQELSTEE